nr:ARID DNA-binding domain-containing protein [Tanacetum cinerariifolium]GEY04499.1 ARID DNA-binding domain-containing protein [Tanacetum cinerariifolium]
RRAADDDKLDRSNEMIAKHLHEYEQVPAELTIREKIDLINELGKRDYWKIIRLGGNTSVYHFFVDMLKQMDIEDLNQLWTLVKETLSIRQASSDKEKDLWVELKRLFEPDHKDQQIVQDKEMIEASSPDKAFDSGNLIKDEVSGELVILYRTPCPIKGVLRSNEEKWNPDGDHAKREKAIWISCSLKVREMESGREAGRGKSKSRRHLRSKQQLHAIQREIRRENEAHLGTCMRKISRDCKEMLKKKLEEIVLHNNTISPPHSSNISENKYKRYKCFGCFQRGHILKFCPANNKSKGKTIDKDSSENTKESEEDVKPANPKVDFFCNIKEAFTVNKLENQNKFIFTYGIGEVIIEDGGHGCLVPGVYYAPEFTLNILSMDLLEKQGFEIIFEHNRCSLVYMFNNLMKERLDEDRLRTRQNQYLEEYFESLANKDVSIKKDLIIIKGNLYSTKVQTFNEYVAFLNLIKQDDILNQEWDIFRNRFNEVVKWFYNYYLDRSLPGPIPPTINGVQIHLFDLYKLVEGLGGYLSVHFCQEFDTIGEILGLSKENGKEIKKCYMNYLDVFTSYFKTARAPQQEYNGGFNQTILKMPTRDIEEGKDRDYHMYHQWDFNETAVQKGKGKMEHFCVKLEDTEKGEDGQEQPTLSHSTRTQNLQGMVLGPSTSMMTNNEDSESNTSDDFTIIT